MPTLEMRVERLEKSSRRWRMACFVALVLLGADCAMQRTAAPAAAAAPQDAQFAHLTAQSLTVRTDAGDVTIRSDGQRVALSLFGPGGSSSVIVAADKDRADLFVTHHTPAGACDASVGADEQSGSVAARNSAGKNKVLEPD